jgi:hypothetical protein
MPAGASGRVEPSTAGDPAWEAVPGVKVDGIKMINGSLEVAACE